MNSPTVDDTHTRAICEEIRERLRTLLRSSLPDETTEIEDKLHQLSDSEVEPESAAAPH